MLKKSKNITVIHKFDCCEVFPDTETLILGTFNPKTIANKADYFYSRPRNHFWAMLPAVCRENGLKKDTKENKRIFAVKHKIGFCDLIRSAVFEKGQEGNYTDKYLDNRVVEWFDVVSLLKEHSKIKRVYFTRKTFNGIKNIKKNILKLEIYCRNNNITFVCLPTPSRCVTESKMHEWENRFNLGTSEKHISS